MSSSSPPPPPPPNHNLNPFNNKSSSRPNPRRSKTTSNPETRWRREPLNDVTNEVLNGMEFIGRGNERRSTRIPSTSSPPTSPNQIQNHYLNHNLPRTSPPRLRRTYTALDLGEGERVIGRGFMELGLNNNVNDNHLRRGGNNIRNLRSNEIGEEGGAEQNRLESTRSVRSRRSRPLTTTHQGLLPSLRGASIEPRRSRTLRDEVSTSSDSIMGEEIEGEGVDGSGRRLRRRRTEGGFR